MPHIRVLSELQLQMHWKQRRDAITRIAVTSQEQTGFAMTTIESQLLERLKKLPPNRVAEVVDFVEFLAVREERAAAAQRLTEGLARLDALNLPPISEEDVEAEVQSARHQRRAQQGA